MCVLITLLNTKVQKDEVQAMISLMDEIIVFLWEKYSNDDKTDYSYAQKLENNFLNDLKKLITDDEFKIFMEEKLSSLEGAYEFLGFKSGFYCAMKFRNEMENLRDN